MAIKSFQHKGLKKFFESGSKAGIQASQANRIGRILDRLDASEYAKDMNAPGYDFHSLKGNLSGFYSVCISGNWRIIFRFENGEAKDVDLVDYH